MFVWGIIEGEMNIVAKSWAVFIALVSVVFLVSLFISPNYLMARNISQYSDLISNSNPQAASNHTFSFVLDTSISPGSYFEITPPTGFEIIGTSTFAAERNVELYANNVLRNSSDILSAGSDRVEIIPGTPGMIRYTLNTSSGLNSGTKIDIKIGNHTSKSLSFSVEYSTTTGTTTTQADIKPIINDATVGNKKFQLQVYDGILVADAEFNIALLEQVGVGPADTREDIPPYRFNGSPTSSITGVSLSVEIFIETNELAICKYSLLPDIAYSAMPATFGNTGLIYHTQVVSVTPNSIQKFYIKCMDDEGNFNIDDYLLEFAVTDRPSGTANEEGEIEGNGTGSGNSGTGSGSGGGGQTGASNGQAPILGGSSGTGGSGGGGGGGSGGVTGPTAGGGFENTDAPYRSGDGRVTISGYTSPRTDLVVLVDGREAQRQKSDNQGKYEVILDEIARGVYTFGIYALDPAQNKSSTFSTSFTVSGARTSALSNINIAPTLKVSPDPVNPGAVLTVTGYSLPNANITLENEKDGSSSGKQQLTATTDSSGSFSVAIETNNFSNGTYKVRAKAEQTQGLIKTNYSAYTFYGVGQAAVRPTSADLNRDGKVNLVDFSILLFWWGTPNGGTSDPSADINGDTKVNLVDFSILLFNWTG